MANDLNRVVLVGRLTRDPELRQTGSGTSYCRISIANNRNYTVNGERREEVSFFNCVAWGRQAEIINQYTRKGKQVAIDGRLQQSSWQNQEGKTQTSVDVVIERLQLLGGAGEGGGGQGGGASYPGPGQQNFSSQNSQGGYGGGASYPQQGGGGFSGPPPQQGPGGMYPEPSPPPEYIDDDDIPF